MGHMGTQELLLQSPFSLRVCAEDWEWWGRAVPPGGPGGCGLVGQWMGALPADLAEYDVPHVQKSKRAAARWAVGAERVVAGNTQGCPLTAIRINTNRSSHSTPERRRVANVPVLSLHWAL